MTELLNILDSEIWNCENTFRSPCPMQWSQLTRTEKRGIRHCRVCDRDVHLCKTPEEFVARGNAGECIAMLDIFIPGQLNEYVLGEPSPEAVRKLEQKNKKCREWWNAVIEKDVDFEPRAMDAVRRSV